MANKPKTNNKGDHTKVSSMDVCQTPRHALEPLYPYLVQNGYKTVWESAHGPEQILVNTLRDKGYDVISTDLSDGEMFNRFTYTPKSLEYDIEITNVPFSIKYQWLAKAFSDGKPFAFLVPYETTFAKDFQNLANTYHFSPYAIEVLSPERRINYKMPNKGWDSSAQMPTMWLTWGLRVHECRIENFRTYYVPMRNVKYNNDNTEIIRMK